MGWKTVAHVEYTLLMCVVRELALVAAMQGEKNGGWASVCTKQSGLGLTGKGQSRLGAHLEGST